MVVVRMTATWIWLCSKDSSGSEYTYVCPSDTQRKTPKNLVRAGKATTSINQDLFVCVVLVGGLFGWMVKKSYSIDHGVFAATGGPGQSILC